MMGLSRCKLIHLALVAWSLLNFSTADAKKRQMPLSCETIFSEGRTVHGAWPGPTSGQKPFRDLGPDVTRFMTLNLRDFFTRTTSTLHLSEIEAEAALRRRFDFNVKLKTKHELSLTTKWFDEIEPSVVFLQEVGSPEMLRAFVEHRLRNRYEIHMLPGNDRIRHVAFLVKKESPFSVERRTHREWTWNDPSDRHLTKRLFARDVPVLILRSRDSGFAPQMKMIVAGVHLKARADRSGGDSGSRELRDAEIQGVVRIIDSLSSEFGDDVPLAIIGDWNDDLASGRSLALVRRKLQVAFDVLGLPYSQRLSHVAVHSEENRQTVDRSSAVAKRAERLTFSQKDGMMLNGAAAQRLLQGFVFTGREGESDLRPLPTRVEQVRALPSDHLPVVFDLYLEPIPSG